MEYICDQIIPITKFENLKMYLNSRVVDGILGEFFYGVWYWYTSINFFLNKKFKYFWWNSIQKMCFFAFF